MRKKEVISEKIRKNAENGRYEHLGNAVIQYIVSTKLYLIFPNHREGKLSIHRSSLMHAKTLASFAEFWKLSEYLSFPPSSSQKKKKKKKNDNSKMTTTMMSKLFQSFIAFLYLQFGLSVCSMFFGKSLFHKKNDILRSDNNNNDDNDNDDILYKLWNKPIRDRLQSSLSDRHLIAANQSLLRLTGLEKQIGLEFDHIQLLLQSFTHPSYNDKSNLFYYVGNNQRMEYLGDAIIHFLVTRYLYFKFPFYNQNQLTNARNSLVNNQIFGHIAELLDFQSYIRYFNITDDQNNDDCDDDNNDNINDRKRNTLMDRSKTNMLADCFEAFVAALYLDKGLGKANVFLEVTLFPLLKETKIEDGDVMQDNDGDDDDDDDDRVNNIIHATKM